MNLPTHIALIPDGNRRWATLRGLPVFMGHREGAKTTEKILTAALEAHIPCLTFWGASISNVTKRDNTEVKFLFKLFTAYFKKISKAKLIHQHKVHINVFGEWKKYFPKETQKAIEGALSATKDYSDFQLTFLLAYSGTTEMLGAINTLIKEKMTSIDESDLKKHLYTKDLPPVDLIIRTGNEPHLSTGFMMWDSADSQLIFSPKMWPDFSPDDFAEALSTFAKTERRLGK